MDKLRDARESHIATIISAFDRQGDHRTGTAVDATSARWLVKEAKSAGIDAKCEAFPLTRVNPNSCFLRIGDRRIEGVPLFDAGFTSSIGVTGTFGRFGSKADIALVSSETSIPSKPGSKSRGALTKFRESRYKGIVLLTEGSRSGLSLLNAPFFGKSFGPPTLQVSSAESKWLHEQARKGMRVTFVANVSLTAAKAFNVTARISGNDKSLHPLVVSTPRSGWWQCASERGGGLVCWLETMRQLSMSGVRRDCYFVALSGHELGFLGIKNYLMRHPKILRGVHAWIHFGANLGAPGEAPRIQSSDSHLSNLGIAELENVGVFLPTIAKPDSVPRGEVSVLQRHGIRYFAPICDSQVFHHASDRWPDAVDIAVLARYVTAFSRLTQKIAFQAI